MNCGTSLTAFPFSRPFNLYQLFLLVLSTFSIFFRTPTLAFALWSDFTQVIRGLKMFSFQIKGSILSWNYDLKLPLTYRATDPENS